MVTTKAHSFSKLALWLETSKLVSCLSWPMQWKSSERSLPRSERDVAFGKAATAGASCMGCSLPANASVTALLQSLETSRSF